MAQNKFGWPDATFIITPTEGHPFTITVKGRDRWALEQLSQAGIKGCTPIDNPAPRWAAYVHSLRGMDVPIVTHTVAHEGPFKGTHARYQLLASIAAYAKGDAA
ncbi:hypothetical protein GGR95_003713 [Sulfitobacter undariae]|uniref:Winged helix domain-containing protein n=1 Tax=Sulfitobacter undariae TaxID=1563671 RepID=A0A7W6H2F9_9RHOB|nr:hypothetical protein [Sulfitobacter undariae]MBB3996047.1 hypothetical protein [Sulfitobacter undariae]